MNRFDKLSDEEKAQVVKNFVLEVKCQKLLEEKGYIDATDLVDEEDLIDDEGADRMDNDNKYL